MNWNVSGKNWIALTIALLLSLGGCSGSDGEPGPPGPPGPPAPPPTTDAADALEIIAVITGVVIASPAVVDFSLSDGNGNGVTGLDAGAISFKIAKLVPGTDGNASAWQSYINSIEEPGVGPGTESRLQATTENGSAGSLVDNNDGSYTYTFALDVANVTDPVPIEYVDTLTHRVTFEIRGLAPVRNPAFDFRPSDGATEGLFTRNIATMSTCNGCHENLAFHGGARFEVEDCVTCHNPGSADANSGNTVDMTVMTHKIHFGKNLPSVEAGEDYCIYGFRDSIHCYGDVGYPQSTTNCEGCHSADNPATPDARNWYLNPTDAACGACHDDVNFATGENHGPGIVADNTSCANCHASNPDSAIEVRQAHRQTGLERAQEFSFNILAIDGGTPGMAPIVTFSVTNPLNADSPYDLANDPELTASSLRFRVTWSTTDYSNTDNGEANAQPPSTDVYDNGALLATENGDFTYSLTLSTVPLSAIGSGVITFEGRVNTSDGGRAPVTSTFRYFAITDDPAAPVARRVSVDIEKCNDCHQALSFHGDNRNNSVEICQVCHLADAARGGTPSAGPMDIKHFVHRLHAIDDIRYPQRVSNCSACHVDGGFYPVSPDGGVRATSFNRGSAETVPSDNGRVSPNTAVCGVCHSSASAGAHMTGNGGSVDACQEDDGTLRERVNFCGPGGNKNGPEVVETCEVCHGPGRFSDVASAHGLD